MNRPAVITSSANPRIKDLIRLRDRPYRDSAGLFLIEGYRELQRAVAAKVGIHEVFFSPALFLGTHEAALIQEAARGGAAVCEVAEGPFRKISYRDRPDGLMATARPVTRPLSAIRLSPHPLVLICQAVEKPGNLGAMLRSADAAGVDAVIVCDGATDVHNPNVVRASTGTLFTVPVVEAGTEETVAWLAGNSVPIVAATPHADAAYTEVDYRDGIAIAVGAEQYGLRDDLMGKAAAKVRIPMAGVADSLNVSTAATLLLFEAARQRGFPVPRSRSGPWTSRSSRSR